MPTTPTFGWPYPAGTDADDVPYWLQQGLVAIENTLKVPVWRGYAATSQTKASGTTLGVTLTEDYAVDGAFTQAAASYVRTIPKSGYYRVTAQCTWQANGTGTRAIDIRKNVTGTDLTTGTTLSRNQMPPTAGSLVATLAEWTGPLTAGDTVAMGALQTSGASLDVVGNQYQTWFEIEWKRPL